MEWFSFKHEAVSLTIVLAYLLFVLTMKIF